MGKWSSYVSGSEGHPSAALPSPAALAAWVDFVTSASES